MKCLTLVLLAMLVGCASNVKPPIDVSLIPNDCANQHAIIRWLESQSQIEPPMWADQEKYEIHRASIKARIWHLRYTCNPV